MAFKLVLLISFTWFPRQFIINLWLTSTSTRESFTTCQVTEDLYLDTYKRPVNIHDSKISPRSQYYSI
jgi:hypothetical protein